MVHTKTLQPDCNPFDLKHKSFFFLFRFIKQIVYLDQIYHMFNKFEKIIFFYNSKL